MAAGIVLQTSFTVHCDITGLENTGHVVWHCNFLPGISTWLLLCTKLLCIISPCPLKTSARTFLPFLIFFDEVAPFSSFFHDIDILGTKYLFSSLDQCQFLLEMYCPDDNNKFCTDKSVTSIRAST